MPLSRRSLLFLAAAGLDAGAAAGPVFSTGVPASTRDKPQSKIWFAHGAWWAWLPVPGGSAIWRRAPDGVWTRQIALDAPLRGLPGQADVWSGAGGVRAVLIEPRRLAVVALRWSAGTYGIAGEPAVMSTDGDAETATIARDRGGRWCVAYNANRHMWVRLSTDATGRQWSAPVSVSATPAAADDICAVTALPGGVGVLWSDQSADAVFFRVHRQGAAPGQWDPPEVAGRGNKTADDHINIAVDKDGRLYVAMKNSVDTVGQPQHVLRVRSPRGEWSSRPYAPLTSERQPTRPIVQLSPDGSRLFLLHTIAVRGRRPAESFIECQEVAPPVSRLDGSARIVIQAAGVTINNVTGAKARLPLGAPWIVLASDGKGDVYEGRL